MPSPIVLGEGHTNERDLDVGWCDNAIWLGSSKQLYATTGVHEPARYKW